MTKLTRQSMLTGKYHMMELPVSKERIQAYLSGEDRRLIQDQFPELDRDEREFLMTGSTPEEWDEAFGEDR